MEIPVPTLVPKPTATYPKVPIPPINKKSFFSSEKKINRFAIFLIISGIGALWLTYWWNKADESDNFGFSSFPVLYYFIFNSTLLFLLGVLLYLKEFKTYSILAIVLGISVTSSLFVFKEGDMNILQSLFLSTTLLGIIFGSIYGGFILVPMFLFGVYKSFFRGVKHIRGKVNYNLS